MKKIIKMFTASLAVIMTIAGFCAMTPASSAVTVYKNRNQIVYEYDAKGNRITKFSILYDSTTKEYTASHYALDGNARLVDMMIYGESRKSTTNKDGSLLTTHSTGSVKAISNDIKINIPTNGTNWQFVNATFSSGAEDYGLFWVQFYVGGFE